MRIVTSLTLNILVVSILSLLTDKFGNMAQNGKE